MRQVLQSYQVDYRKKPVAVSNAFNCSKPAKSDNASSSASPSDAAQHPPSGSACVKPLSTASTAAKGKAQIGLLNRATGSGPAPARAVGAGTASATASAAATGKDLASTSAWGPKPPQSAAVVPAHHSVATAPRTTQHAVGGRGSFALLSGLAEELADELRPANPTELNESAGGNKSAMSLRGRPISISASPPSSPASLSPRTENSGDAEDGTSALAWTQVSDDCITPPPHPPVRRATTTVVTTSECRVQFNASVAASHELANHLLFSGGAL